MNDYTNLLARAQAACDRADLGATMRLRIDAKTCVSGTLVKVEPAEPVRRGLSKVAIPFRVTLECGSNKTLRTFVVRQIPAL